jgi:hypothetical protein
MQNTSRGGRVSSQYIVALLLAVSHSASAAPVIHDIIIRNGMIYDGSGAPPVAGDVAIDGDRIAYVGPHRALKARRTLDAKGRAVSPGFTATPGRIIRGRAWIGRPGGGCRNSAQEWQSSPATSDRNSKYRERSP